MFTKWGEIIRTSAIKSEAVEARPLLYRTEKYSTTKLMSTQLRGSNSDEKERSSQQFGTSEKNRLVYSYNFNSIPMRYLRCKRGLQAKALVTNLGLTAKCL